MEFEVSHEYTTDGNPDLLHVRHIGSGSSSHVHERKFTTATDIWSMGCMLYELAAGKRHLMPADYDVIVGSLQHNPFLAPLDHAPYEINVKEHIS